MVIKVTPDGLFKQLNMTWCHVVSKITMGNVHVDVHLKQKYILIKTQCVVML
jgi:hypothetical protein